MRSLKMSPKKHSAVSAKCAASVWAACSAYVFFPLSAILAPRADQGPRGQATLEIEFMHQTLARYVTRSADETLSELYTKISQAYAKRPGDENLQANRDGVKKTLADARRATGIEFLCFRPTKDRSKDKSRDPEGRTRDRSERRAK